MINQLKLNRFISHFLMLLNGLLKTERKKYNKMPISHTMIIENDMQNDLNTTKQLLISENIQPNPELIDDCFYVEQKNFGSWISYDKDKKNLITAYTREDCISSTQFYLKFLQDNGTY